MRIAMSRRKQLFIIWIVHKWPPQDLTCRVTRGWEKQVWFLQEGVINSSSDFCVYVAYLMSPIYLRRHNASNMSYRISTCLLSPSKSISFVENPGFRVSHLHLFILHLSASKDRAGRHEVNYVGENGICLYNVSPPPLSHIMWILAFLSWGHMLYWTENSSSLLVEPFFKKKILVTERRFFLQS